MKTRLNRLLIRISVIAACAWGNTWMASAASPPAEYVELSRKAALKSSHSSQLASLVGGWFSSWKHMAKGNYTAHARDTETLKRILHEGYYYGLLIQDLLKQPQPDSVHLVVVDKPRTWYSLLSAKPHGGVQSFYADGVIFLYWPEGEDGKRDLSDLPHEMVHAWIAASDAGLPLWLEEGLALSWGESLAQKYYTLQNRFVKAEEAASPVRPLDPTVFMHYPEDAVTARRFYRSSKLLVRAIERLLDDSEFRTFLSRMVEPDISWQQVLKEEWRIPDKKIQSMQQLVNPMASQGGR